MSIMVSTHFPADVPHQSSDYYHEHLKCKNGSEALPGKLCVWGGGDGGHLYENRRGS